jgi:hypothetical protein
MYSYITIFMKTGAGVQAILKSGLRNLRGCNVSKTASCAMIYIPSLIKICSGIRKLMVEGRCIHIQKHRQQSDLTSPLLFFRNKRGLIWKMSQNCDSAYFFIPRNL